MSSVVIADSVISSPAETFQHRVLAVLEARGQSKVWLAKKLNISKQAMHYLLVLSTKPKYVSEIATALEVSVEWLLTGKGSATVVEQQQVGLLKLPIHTMHDIGPKTLGDENQCGKFAIFAAPDNADYFAVLLDNPSMEPLFHQNSVLIFKKIKQAQSGDYILFSPTAENGAVFRQFIRDGGDVYLKALNPSFRTIENEPQRVLGVLIESRILI